MQIIRTLSDLDAKIEECNLAEAQSDEALRALFPTFRMEMPKKLPADPFALEYREIQLALYHEIAGVPYSLAQEKTKFDVETALRDPFPFHTRSTAVAGEYLMAIGFLLQVMALPGGSRVLEFGAGWGFTTLSLAKLGHKVSVIEIEPCFCDFIKRQAEREKVTIEIINADFFHIESEKRQFDALLFYDCFHHCDDHMRLLRALDRVLSPGGRVFFGGEPISNEFTEPWGLRLDGWSLWGIRKNGWMELGFREDYFAQALLRAGLFARKASVPGFNRLRVWEARRIREAIFRYPASAPEIRTEIGKLYDHRLILDGTRRGTGIFGPYVDLPAGRYGASIIFAPAIAAFGEALMDIAANGGSVRLAKQKLRFSGEIGASAHLQFEILPENRSIEVRLICERGFRAAIDCVEIWPLPEGPELDDTVCT
jgi:SAM-dependent methyltransferase